MVYFELAGGGSEVGRVVSILVLMDGVLRAHDPSGRCEASGVSILVLMDGVLRAPLPVSFMEN